MLIIAMMLAQAAPTVAVPAASTALRSTARAALPASVFTPGLTVVDEQGGVVGKVVSSEQGVVTLRTAHAVIRMPTSAFLMRGGPVMIGVPAALVDTLARTGMPTR